MSSVETRSLKLVESASVEPPKAGRERRPGIIGGLLAFVLVLTVYADALYDFRYWGVAAGLAMAGLAGVVLAGRVSLTGPALLALSGLALLLGLTAVSLMWSDSVERAWLELHRLLLYVGVFVVGIALLGTPPRARAFLAVLAAAGGSVGAIQLIGLLAGDQNAFVEHRLSAPVAYINGSAGFFLICMWPAVAFAERSPRPAVAALAMTAVVVEGNLLVLTQSRAVIPALLVAAVVLVVAIPGRVTRVWLLLVGAVGVAGALPWTLDVFARGVPGTPPDTSLLAAAGAAIAISAVLAGCAWGLVTRARGRSGWSRARRWSGPAVASILVATVAVGAAAAGNPADAARSAWREFTANAVDTSASTRFGDASGFRYDLWRVAWREFSEEPLRGVGAGSYGLRYFALRENPESVRQPHNLPLQLLAELGIGGAVALLMLVTGVMWGLFRCARVDATLAVAAGGVFLAWFTQTSVDWLWNLPTLTCIALLAAAALVAAGAQARAAHGPHRAIAVAVLLVVACGSTSLGRQYIGEDYRHAAQKALADDPAETLRATRRALEYAPASVDSLVLRAAAFARFGDYRHARATLLEAARREPRNFLPWALLGDIAARRGDYVAARDAYAAALERNPREPALAAVAQDPRLAPDADGATP